MSATPRYQNAPVSEMTLTISFTPDLSGLTMLDVVELYEKFRHRYPFFQHLPIAEPMTATPTIGYAMPQLSVGPQPPVLPRANFSAADLQTALFFQFDRMTTAWRRQAPLGAPDTYPGFERMLQKMRDEMSILREWIKSRGLPDLSPVVGELGYINSFEMEPNGKRRSLEDIFAFYTNPRKAKMHSFNCAWTEPLGEDSKTGNLNALVQGAVLPDGQAGVYFNLLGSVDLSPGGWDDADQALRLVHSRLNEMFEGSLRPDFLRRA
jgi:uncharacterized protein (TIGR04255 family)